MQHPPARMKRAHFPTAPPAEAVPSKTAAHDRDTLKDLLARLQDANPAGMQDMIRILLAPSP